MSTEQTHNTPKVKGDFNGLCNRTACQSPIEVEWYNHSTQKYYCTECAHLLNKVNHGDAQRLFNHNLCTRGQN